jgi:hypothetical protein
MPRPDGPASDLEVVGQLSILADEVPFQVDFRGRVIEVALPDLRTALRLARGLPRGDRRSWLLSSQASLARAGLELLVLVGRRPVARLAATSRPGRLARWLGLDPMEVESGTILASLLGWHPVSSTAPRSGES